MITMPHTNCDNVTNFLKLVVECDVCSCGVRVGLLGCRWHDICGIYILDKQVFNTQVRIFIKDYFVTFLSRMKETQWDMTDNCVI